MNENEGYGMCCSREMAEQCENDYEEYARWERRADNKEIAKMVIGVLVSLIGFPVLLGIFSELF